MEPEGDPEARIRDLERQLGDAAEKSELGIGAHGSTYGYVPPPSGSYAPPPPTTPWEASPPPFSPMSSTGHSRTYVVPVVIAVLAVVIAGGVSLYLFTMGASNPGKGPQIAGGGSNLSDSPPEGSSAGGGKTQVPSRQATAPDLPAPGSHLTVAGMGQNKTIACNETTLSISGMENTVTVTGHCISVSVSGMDNAVAVDSAESIVVSGFDNRIVFHTGEPKTSSSGSGNTIDRG
jgi:hypothetical protein